MRFQSWRRPAVKGVHEVPVDLPQSDACQYSHARLIIEGLDLFGP